MSQPRSYYRIMAGAKSVYANESFEGGFIGGDWQIDQKLADISQLR